MRSNVGLNELLALCRYLGIALADVADMTENLKVIKDSLSTFAPRNYMVYVENGAIACLDAT